MPQPQGEELARVRARREDLRKRYLHPLADRGPSTVSGVHHLALICKDAEETIKFYQEFLGFPLVELVENRDYAGSNHFFFDIGNHNLLGFFDFPGHEHPPWQETIGGVQHLAISVTADQFDAAKNKFDEAGLDYLGPDRGGWTRSSATSRRPWSPSSCGAASCRCSTCRARRLTPAGT